MDTGQQTICFDTYSRLSYVKVRRGSWVKDRVRIDLVRLELPEGPRNMKKKNIIPFLKWGRFSGQKLK